MRFIVYGEPCGKGRPRFTREGTPYTPSKTLSFEKLIQTEYMIQVREKPFPRGICLKIVIDAYMSYPRNIVKWKIPLIFQNLIRPTKKPDWDNIGKIVADALNGVAYHDDSQIVTGIVNKYYSNEPRTEIEITLARSFNYNITKAELNRCVKTKKKT